MWPYEPPGGLAEYGEDLQLPKISVITPSFNQAAYIEETILSVLNQGYPNLEFIIIDNDSSDGTREILERYRDRVHHLLIEPDAGQSNALNKGFALAQGSILTWLNSDDMLAPGALYQVAAAFASGAPDLVCGTVIYTRQDEVLFEHVTAVPSGRLVASDLLDIESQWLEGRYFFQPELFFSRNIFDKTGGYIDENLFYSMDFDLWVRMAVEGAYLHVIGAPLCIFRAHPAQKTSDATIYRPELRAHAQALHEKLGAPPSPPRKPTRRVRICFVNDGPDGGAALAHRRLHAILSQSGFDTALIHLLPMTQNGRPMVDVGRLLDEVKLMDPDLVLIGNLHAVGNDNAVLEMLAINFSCAMWLHDMWLLTGRCVYNKGCQKFLSICDDRCPTREEYPAAPADQIQRMHGFKTKIQTLFDFRLIANSEWMAARVKAFEAAHESDRSGPRAIMVLTPPAQVGDFLRVRCEDARDLMGIPRSEDVVVCSAANLGDDRKGLAYVVDAIDELSRLGYHPLCIFVGWAEPAVRTMLSRHSHCVFLGYLTEEVLPYVYGAADIMLSGATDEAFGMSYVEAAAAGARTVAFRSGGVAEAVRDGVSGVLADAFSGKALAAAAISLLDRKARGEDLRIGPRLWAEAQHSDMAVLHRFVSQLTTKWLPSGPVPPRAQLQRPGTLSDRLGPAKTADLPRLRALVSERISPLDGVGELSYRLEGEGGVESGLLRIRMSVSAQNAGHAAPGERQVSLKLVWFGGQIYIDVRPTESKPPLLRRAFVELGVPFISDDWGPTLFIKLGDREQLKKVHDCLPAREFDSIMDALLLLSKALRSRAFGAGVAGMIEATGFPMSISALAEALEAWRPTCPLTPPAEHQGERGASAA